MTHRLGPRLAGPGRCVRRRRPPRRRHPGEQHRQGAQGPPRLTLDARAGTRRIPRSRREGRHRIDGTSRTTAGRPNHRTRSRILTPRGSYTVGVARFPGTRVGTAISRGSGREVECRGLRAKFDGGADVVTVSVPASCLEQPRWVKLGVAAVGIEIPEGDFPDTVPFFADDGHRGTIRDTSIGKGPRIHRG